MLLTQTVYKKVLNTSFFIHCLVSPTHPFWPACREVLYEDGPDGVPRVTGLRVGREGAQRVVQADAYVAALDVPGAKRLIPQPWRQ
jgi:zeta-carotene desaturase